MKNLNRRHFLQRSGWATTAAFLTSFTRPKSPLSADPKRYLGNFATAPLSNIRMAFIGVGYRGHSHAEQWSQISGTEIVAVCDLYKDLVEKTKTACEKHGQGNRHNHIKTFSDSDTAWKKMLEEVEADAVVISTNWKNHAPMAIAAMEAGAHAFVEVPLALTLDEMWALVRTAEATQKHCMMLENVNYGREELLFLNLCRQQKLGDLLHGEAAYIHELRWQMDEVERGTGSWRTDHYAARNGNLYPTHGLGPIAQYMNIGRRDDLFHKIVSFSSPAKGRQRHAQKNYPKEHRWNQLDFLGGDLNSSLIKTQMGRTILVQWDETSPRPYSRHNLIQGSLGILAGFPTRLAFEGGVPGLTDSHHQWIQGEQLESVYEKYEHPLYKRLGALAEKMGGHGGMDFMMRYRVVECLQKGEPLDQNIYEGCFWSAVAPLSERSVAQDGLPQNFPDFTRGQWKNTTPLAIVS